MPYDISLHEEKENEHCWLEPESKWKDGTTNWITISILKEHNLVEFVDYTVVHQAETEPTFTYWVPHMLKNRSYSVTKVDTRAKRVTHKYGIKLPHDKDGPYSKGW